MTLVIRTLLFISLVISSTSAPLKNICMSIYGQGTDRNALANLGYHVPTNGIIHWLNRRFAVPLNPVLSQALTTLHLKPTWLGEKTELNKILDAEMQTQNDRALADNAEKLRVVSYISNFVNETFNGRPIRFIIEENAPVISKAFLERWVYGLELLGVPVSLEYISSQMVNGLNQVYKIDPFTGEKWGIPPEYRNDSLIFFMGEGTQINYQNQGKIKLPPNVDRVPRQYKFFLSPKAHHMWGQLEKGFEKDNAINRFLPLDLGSVKGAIESIVNPETDVHLLEYSPRAINQEIFKFPSRTTTNDLQILSNSITENGLNILLRLINNKAKTPEEIMGEMLNYFMKISGYPEFNYIHNLDNLTKDKKMYNSYLLSLNYIQRNMFYLLQIPWVITGEYPEEIVILVREQLLAIPEIRGISTEKVGLDSPSNTRHF